MQIQISRILDIQNGLLRTLFKAEHFTEDAKLEPLACLKCVLEHSSRV